MLKWHFIKNYLNFSLQLTFYDSVFRYVFHKNMWIQYLNSLYLIIKHYIKKRCPPFIYYTRKHFLGKLGKHITDNEVDTLLVNTTQNPVSTNSLHPPRSLQLSYSCGMGCWYDRRWCWHSPTTCTAPTHWSHLGEWLQPAASAAPHLHLPLPPCHAGPTSQLCDEGLKEGQCQR